MVDQAVDRALCSVETALCAVDWLVDCALRELVWSFGRSTRQSTGPAIAEQFLRAVARAVGHYSPFFLVHAIVHGQSPSRSLAYCLRLCLVFYLTPLNSDLCTIFLDEFKKLY